MRRHVAVLGLDQHVAMRIDQDGAERMIAVGHCAAGDLEGPAQKMRVIRARNGIGHVINEYPAMCRSTPASLTNSPRQRRQAVKATPPRKRCRRAILPSFLPNPPA